MASLVDSDHYIPSAIYNTSDSISIGPNFNSLFDCWQLLRCQRFAYLDELLWFDNDGLAFLSMLHKCCQQSVFWSSVLLYTSPTVQLSTTRRKPSLIFVCATSPIFRGHSLSHEKMWHPAHVPCFARAVGKKDNKRNTQIENMGKGDADIQYKHMWNLTWK